MNIHEQNGSKVAVFDAQEVAVASTQDALDLLPLLWAEDNCHRLVLYSASLSGAFFDLKTGLAGDILQKLTNYRIQVAIVGDFTHVSSRSLGDFIRESNKGGGVFFVPTLAEALDKLHSLKP